MPTTRLPTLATLLLLSVGAPALAAAQAGPMPRAGEQVRVRILGPEHAPVGLRCDGWVAAVARDTVVLGPPGNCPRGSYFADLRIAHGDRGSRLVHMGLGLLGGALAGGVISRIGAGDGCHIEGCDDGDFAVGIITLAGTATGAVIGALVGVTLPAGTQWLTETATRPLRVAGFDVHPEVRVSAR